MSACSLQANFPAYTASSNQSMHSWKSVLKALQQFNQSMCILSELSAQEWWYIPSSSYSVILSKQQRAKNVFVLGKCKVWKKITQSILSLFFLIFQVDISSPLTRHCLQFLCAFVSQSVLDEKFQPSEACNYYKLLRHSVYRLAIQM